MSPGYARTWEPGKAARGPSVRGGRADPGAVRLWSRRRPARRGSGSAFACRAELLGTAGWPYPGRVPMPCQRY